MISIPVISNPAFYTYRKRIQILRIASPLALISIAILTLVTGQSALFLLTLPLFAYFGYMVKSWTEKQEDLKRDTILILGSQGAQLFEGKKELWSLTKEQIESIEEDNAFHPSPDTLQQYIDDIQGNPYESYLKLKTNEGVMSLRILVRSFHEGNEIRRWCGKGFELSGRTKKIKVDNDLVMS